MSVIHRSLVSCIVLAVSLPAWAQATAPAPGSTTAPAPASAPAPAPATAPAPPAPAPATQPVLPALTLYTSTVAYEQKPLVIEPTGAFAAGRRYIHAPRAEWTPVAGVAKYQVLLLQGEAVLGITESPASPVIARTGWEKIRPGKASIAIQGFDAGGNRIALSRLVPFHVTAGFNPATVAAAKRPYREAALQAFAALEAFKLPPTTSAPTTGPALTILPALLTAGGNANGYVPYSFPARDDWRHAEMLERLLKIADDPLKARIATYARSIGEHLLMSRIPAEGNLYGNTIRACVDVHGQPALSRAVPDEVLRDKMLRLVEPAMCGYAGDALLRVSEITGEARYLDAAVALADTLVRTQQTDGSWPGCVDGRTGEVLAGYSSSVGAVAAFLNRLAPKRPDPRWAPAEERARAWMMAQTVQNRTWISYSDEQGPSLAATPSNADLFSFIRYLCRVHAVVPRAVDSMVEQLQWNDSFFAFYGSDPLLVIEPFYPVCAAQGVASNLPDTTWMPVDAQTADWALALIEMHRLTKDPQWLAVAKGAAGALTQYQLDNGRTMHSLCDRVFGLSAHPGGTPTTHVFRPPGWAAAAATWAELAALGE